MPVIWHPDSAIYKWRKTVLSWSESVLVSLYEAEQRWKTIVHCTTAYGIFWKAALYIEESAPFPGFIWEKLRKIIGKPNRINVKAQHFIDYQPNARWLSVLCPDHFRYGSPYTHENTAPLARKTRTEENHHDYFNFSAKKCRRVEVTFMEKYFNISAEPARDCLPARKQHMEKQTICHELSARWCFIQKEKY